MPKKATRYVLHPGPVRSKTDGDLHWIGAHRLAGLYGVPMSECLVARDGRVDRPLGVIHLHPRWDGDYRLPQTEKEPE